MLHSVLCTVCATSVKIPKAAALNLYYDEVYYVLGFYTLEELFKSSGERNVYVRDLGCMIFVLKSHTLQPAVKLGTE